MYQELLVVVLIILVAFCVQLVAVIRWRKNIRMHAYGSLQRVIGKRQNEWLLVSGAFLMLVGIMLMPYMSFFLILDKLHAHAVETGAVFLSLANLFSMLWAVSDTVCNSDYSLTYEQRKRAVKSNHRARKGAMLCFVLGFVCVAFALFAPSGMTMEVYYPLRFAFGVVACVLGIILLWAWRRFGENTLLMTKSEGIRLPHNLPIGMLVLGFFLVGVVFMISSFIP